MLQLIPGATGRVKATFKANGDGIANNLIWVLDPALGTISDNRDGSAIITPLIGLPDPVTGNLTNVFANSASVEITVVTGLVLDPSVPVGAATDGTVTLESI